MITMLEQKQLSDDLNRELDELVSGLPGADVRRLRMAGTKRRRRSQLAMSTAVLTVATGAAVVGVSFIPGPASAPPAAQVVTGQTSDAAAVNDLLVGALTDAGISVPAGLPESPVGVTGEDGEPYGWSLVWTEDTDPRTSVMLDVLPEGSSDPELDPCAAPAQEVRSCSRETLPNGTQIMVGETHAGGFITDTGRWTMWTPVAVAAYPDGRVVSARVDLTLLDGESPPPGDLVVETYTGPITLDQLRQTVLDPSLTTITLPTSAPE